MVDLIIDRKEPILVLPYIGQQSSEIRNRIQCCLEKNAPVFKLKVVFQSNQQLSRLFTFKYKINKILHSNLVYKFKCNICNDICYGKTNCHFKVRPCERLGIAPLTGKKVKSPKKVQYLIIFSILVITQVLMVLKPLSKSLMNLESSSQSRF